MLAPHYDDEVLGCGGLLAQLARRGGAVRVLFLTDGAGGDEHAADAAGRVTYAALRRSESERAAVALGLQASEHLGVPDGQLAQRVEEAARAIRHALLGQRPDLLLVPSPLETTADHRAAFAALHRVLSPIRPGDELEGVAAQLRILLYDVNHPGYPDLLVDVGAELPTIEAAMGCYASQEARHPYLAAGLGLRRFRALSLEPGRAAVEGYRRLDAADFATRGLARLVHDLGGVAVVDEVREGRRISVVVRTKDRPRLLAEALASLGAGSYRRVEIVLVNDGGAPPEVPAGFPFPVVRVELPENRGRAAAANAGVAAATGEFVAFLDDDDLAEPEHLSTLAGLVAAAGVRVAYSDAAVGIYEIDPAAGWRQHERRLPYSRDFDPDLLLLDNYIPFNTLLVERALFAEVGPFDAALPFFEDWDFLIRLAQRTPFHHLRQVTCEYRQFRGAGHHVLGDRPRERADFLAMKQRVLAKHAALLQPEVLARAVDRLRRDAVDSGEATAAARREAAAARDALVALGAERAGLEERYHRLNGERVALAGEIERLQAGLDGLTAERDRQRGELDLQRAALDRQRQDLERLYAEETRLRGVNQEQIAHIGKLYAEVERLNALIRAMEATRAWRVHRFLERLRV